MQCPEVPWQARLVPDSVRLAMNVRSLLAPTSREYKLAFPPVDAFKHLPCAVIKRYGLINASFGLPDMDKTPVKINVLPLKSEQL